MSPSQKLLSWYDRHRRDLPWRSTRDPYRIWLSEVLLQQTRVEVATPYYHRILARFPSLAELAAGPVEELLALWSGLGYYRRARQLHAAAVAVVAAGGRFPETADGWRRLPGVGAYTAAAVASIAFGEPVAVLDGNVERVLARYLAFGQDPRSAPGRRHLSACATQLLDPERPGDSNQALMELGATLCAPQRPKCLLCPLAEGCVARRSGTPGDYPAPRRKRAVERRRLLAAVVEADGAVLLFRRPDRSSLLGGTWELPWIPAEDGDAETAEAAFSRRYGGAWAVGERLGAVRHAITFRDLTVEVCAARVDWGGEVQHGAAAGWFGPEKRAGLFLSSLVEKILAQKARATPEAPARRSRSRRR